MGTGTLPDFDEELLWPFLHILVAADDDDLVRWVLQDFGTDRYLRPKGVVEVILGLPSCHPTDTPRPRPSSKAWSVAWSISSHEPTSNPCISPKSGVRTRPSSANIGAR